jgi:hypothetical protein
LRRIAPSASTKKRVWLVVLVAASLVVTLAASKGSSSRRLGLAVTEVTAPPDFFQPWTWGQKSQPNLQ